MGLAKACFSHFRVGIGWYLWSWRRKELPVAVPPASEATSRGAEHSQLLPFLMLPTPACPIKKDRRIAVFFCGAGGSTKHRYNLLCFSVCSL